ncbi:MAG: hypothetical protein CM15mP51_09540 [Porticoccaceae bacterium]|nr:MAG: hypothetical protein CM15mP51_09540 [Porticoccaceae bacterium]
MRQIREVSNIDPNGIPDEILSSKEPVLLKNLVGHWPLVEAAKKSDSDISHIFESLMQKATHSDDWIP